MLIYDKGLDDFYDAKKLEGRNKKIMNSNRVRLTRIHGKKARKYLELGQVYFIRGICNDTNIYLKGFSKSFNASLFEPIDNKYDWISSK